MDAWMDDLRSHHNRSKIESRTQFLEFLFVYSQVPKPVGKGHNNLQVTKRVQPIVIYTQSLTPFAAISSANQICKYVLLFPHTLKLIEITGCSVYHIFCSPTFALIIWKYFTCQRSFFYSKRERHSLNFTIHKGESKVAFMMSVLMRWQYCLR